MYTYEGNQWMRIKTDQDVLKELEMVALSTVEYVLEESVTVDEGVYKEEDTVHVVSGGSNDSNGLSM